MSRLICIILLCSLLGGCTSLDSQPCACDSHKHDLLSQKTLLKWSSSSEDDKDGDSKKKDEQKKDGQDDKSSEPKDNNKASAKEETKTDPRSEPLKSDRPDFTEASTTVGKGVVQLETGYTYTRDHSGINTSASHSYPEALLRIGMFVDWFEWRIGQNFSNGRNTGDDNSTFHGSEDTYLGIKLALSEQQNCLPELAVIFQATVPTGKDELTADHILPGINFLFGWEVIKDKLELGGSFQANKAANDINQTYLELAQSITVGYTLTEKLGAFTEWFAIYPSGASFPDVGPQYYFDGGFTYMLTKNIQFDINAGVGLNRHADDYFVGTGLVVRY
ncbi:MAG: transporter [Gemmatales bacterium]